MDGIKFLMLIRQRLESAAKIGTEKVIINKERNAKECFTVIGRVLLNKLYSILIVSKGTTDQSKAKLTNVSLIDFGSCIVWYDV